MKNILLRLSGLNLQRLISIGMFIMMSPFVASAAAQSMPGIDVGTGQGALGLLAPIICTVAYYLFWILIALSVIFVLVAAYQYLTSSGEPQKVSTATKTITFAAVGIVVALLARGFPLIIVSVFPTVNTIPVTGTIGCQ